MFAVRAKSFPFLNEMAKSDIVKINKVIENGAPNTAYLRIKAFRGSFDFFVIVFSGEIAHITTIPGQPSSFSKLFK